MIDAVLFDLDDTIYDQGQWLRGAWRAVASAAPDGLDRSRLLEALVRIAAEGTDKGRIIDRALERLGAVDVPIQPLLDAFRGHAPEGLEGYPGAADALYSLRQRVPVGLVSDGDPAIQRNKLRALDLDGAFDVVVLSDELGRDRRKPDPAPFLQAAEWLGADPARCVMVGDRPDKDIRGARQAGFRGAVRVRTGEHAGQPDESGCLFSASSLESACAWLLSWIEDAALPASPR